MISPLLANIALHGLENHLNEFAKTIDMRRPDGRRQEGWQMKVQSLNFVRYADDFVLMHRDKKVILDGKKVIEKWLSEVGLELKPSKTRIAHTLLPEESEDGQAGFDFLGFHIRTFKVGYHSSLRLSTGKRPGIRTLITPTKKAYKKHQEKLRATIKDKKIEGQAELIGKLNPIIRGWMNYYKTSDISTVGGHSNQDNDLYHKLRSWGRRRCKTDWKGAYAKFWNYTIVKGRKVNRFSTREGKTAEDIKLINAVRTETLAVKNMMANHKLAKAIADCPKGYRFAYGWGEALRQFQYKCKWHDRKIGAIDRWFPSSKRCNPCGHILNKLPLSVRTWTCPNCGSIRPRDRNAAENILAIGRTHAAKAFVGGLPHGRPNQEAVGRAVFASGLS